MSSDSIDGLREFQARTAVTILDRIDEAVVAVDSDWNVTFVNDRFEDLTGRDATELVGRALWTGVPDAIIDMVGEECRRVMHRREPVEFEAYCEPFDRWFGVRAIPGDSGFSMHLTDVTDRKERERELELSESSIRRVYEITSDSDMAFEEKISRILAIGRDWLGLQYAFVTRTDDGRQHVVESVGSHDLLQAGESCPLSEAYCRKTIRSEGLLGVQNAASEGWDDDPAYERFGLGCYLGGRVIVDGDLYGTVCFADDSARDTPFTDGERAFVELLVRWIGYELSLRQNERRLQRLQRTASELLLATTDEEVARIALNAVRSVLNHPITGIWRYDAENRRLEPIAETTEARSTVGPAPPFEEGEGLVWEAFEDGEIRSYHDVQSRSDAYNPDTPVRSEVIVPLGRYGVITTGSIETGTFTETDVGLLRLLAVTVEAAFVRVKRERLLQETRERLENKNEALAVLNRIVRHDIGNEVTAVLGWAEVLEDHVGPRNEEYVHRVLTAAEQITRIVGPSVTSSRSSRGPRNRLRAPGISSKYSFPRSNGRSPRTTPSSRSTGTSRTAFASRRTSSSRRSSGTS